MDDKDRGPDKAGLKKLCTMAKAILPPPAQSTMDNDVEMHTFEKDTFPQASTETASATDINYYVEKEKISGPTTVKPAKRHPTQIARATGNAFDINPTHENDSPACECPVELLNNDAKSSTISQGNKKQPDKAITSVITKASNTVIESTREENVEGVAAIAKEKGVVTLNSKKQIANKSVQNIPDIKSSSMGTAQKLQTRNKNTTDMKPTMSRSTKINADAPKKKNVTESDNKVEDRIAHKKAIPGIGKPIVNKPKPLATSNAHEYSTSLSKKKKKFEDGPIKAAHFSEEGFHTSPTVISTDDDSGASMEVQFSWDGAMAAEFAIEEECSNQSYKNEKSNFFQQSLDDVKDFSRSSNAKKLTLSVENNDSINTLLAPRCATTKTPIEAFLTEKDVSDIVSMNKKTSNARAKYVSRPDSVFTIDATWATAPNVIFDLDRHNQKVRPGTSPGRINVATNFDKQSCQDLPRLLVSKPLSDSNHIQEQKMSSADMRAHEIAYNKAPELYSLVVVNPVNPSHEIETDVEIAPDETGPQSVHDTRDVCPEPHSPNQKDSSMENLSFSSTTLAESLPKKLSQPINDLTEPTDDNICQDTSTTLRRRGSAKQEELNQYLDYLQEKPASPTGTISPGMFWNFFQIFGSVLNICQPHTQPNQTSGGENDKEKQTTNVEDNLSAHGSASQSLKSENIRSKDESNEDSKQQKEEKDNIVTECNNINANGDNNTLKKDVITYSGPFDECPKYLFKDLFTCFTNKMYWLGICPNKINGKMVNKFLSRILQILAIIVISLSLADSVMMIKVYGLIFFQDGWELHEFVNLSFNVMHACTKGYFLFLVSFRWETVAAFVPIHQDLMQKCCSNESLEDLTKWNEFLANCMRAVTILMALLYAMLSKFDLKTAVVTLASNFRVNAAATDILTNLWGKDEDKNGTSHIIHNHLNDEPISYETFMKGMIGEGMEFSGQAHDEMILDTMITVVACLHLSTLVVVDILKRAAPDGVDRQAYTDWQWIIYHLLRLLAETINATFGMLWTFMHYHNLLMIANFGFRMVWEPTKVMWWFQGSSILKLGSIYYLGHDTHSQNTFIEEWIRGICADKTEVTLAGKDYNVILLLDDVTKNPIGFGQGKCLITGDFIFHVIEKVASFFIMFASFRQKPCDCEELCKKLVLTLADTLHHKEKKVT